MKLSDYKKNITSQHGEDGIIEKMLETIGDISKWCVDVGAYGMTKSNTYSLIDHGWNGILIDTKDGIRRLKRLYGGNSQVELVCIKIDTDLNKLDNILGETPIPKEFGLLSIDIDGNDYHIWESLQNYTPTIILIEFNPRCQLGYYIQPIDGQGGASLSSIVQLGKEKGYELVTATILNAIFVRKELFPKFGISNNSPEQFFTVSDSLYGRDKKNYAIK